MASRKRNGHSGTNGSDGGKKFEVHLDRNHLPEPEWAFPNAHIPRDCVSCRTSSWLTPPSTMSCRSMIVFWSV